MKKDHLSKILVRICLLISISLLSCSRVPKESVELSATVGRDIAEMHRAHKELAILYYDGIINNINDFVDNVYTPYQIQKTLEEYKDVLITSIETASRPNSSEEEKKNTIDIIEIYLEELRNEIENYRKEKLNPVINQRDTFIKNIDHAYEQIHYANSIVTGHLSSVVKVHNTQDEILEKLDLINLRNRLDAKTTEISEKISKLIQDAHKGNKEIDKLIEEFDKLTAE